MIREYVADETEIKVNSFDEALRHNETDFSVSSIETDLKSLDLEEDGTVKAGESRYPITDWCFESMCKNTGIEPSFARSLTPNLFLPLFNGLKERWNKSVALVIQKQTNMAINVVDANYLDLCAKNQDILTRAATLMPSLYETCDITISLKGISIDLLVGEGRRLEPIKDDITQFGLKITNSETGYRGAKAVFYLNRVVCKNGAIISNVWGTSDWSYDHRISYERALLNFFSKIETMEFRFDEFAPLYQAMVSYVLKGSEIIKILRRVSPVVGRDKAYGFINGISKEDIKEYSQRIRENHEDPSTALVLYNVFNDITSAARTLPITQSMGLQRVAGKLIEMAIGHTEEKQEVGIAA